MPSSKQIHTRMEIGRSGKFFQIRCLCGRYFGNADQQKPFRRLAQHTLSALQELNSHVLAGHGIPAEALLEMPKYPDHLGVLELIYETAGCYSTDLLRAEPDRWNVTGQVTLTEAEDEEWSTTPSGVRFPAHPFYESLREGLLLSLAESIRYWLD